MPPPPIELSETANSIRYPNFFLWLQTFNASNAQEPLAPDPSPSSPLSPLQLLVPFDGAGTIAVPQTTSSSPKSESELEIDLAVELYHKLIKTLQAQGGYVEDLPALLLSTPPLCLPNPPPPPHGGEAPAAGGYRRYDAEEIRRRR